AGLLGAHTLAVTAVSGNEVHGGDPMPSLAGLAVTAAVTWGTAGRTLRGTNPALPATAAGVSRRRGGPPAWATAGSGSVTAASAAVYGATFGLPLVAAALSPTGPKTRRAVAAGIQAMLPLQAALTARAGAPRTGALLLALLPAARRLSRKV